MKKKILALFLGVATSFILADNCSATNIGSELSQFSTLTSNGISYPYTMYSQNNILFYEPCDGNSNGGIAGSCGGEIETPCGDTVGRVEELVEKYGTLAMNLQIAYGVSWEFLLAQTAYESQVGCAGVAESLASEGYYNWLGLSYLGGNHARYANGNVSARPASEGGGYEVYDTIEDMFKSYASGDFLRNGYYDEAFQYTDKNNYNLEQYIITICPIYAAGCTGASSSYVTTTLWYIKDVIRPKAEELGYPTTEELQKEKNIDIGGEFPIGSSDVYDDSVGCGSVGYSSSSSSSDTSSSSNDGVTLAQLAVEAAWSYNEAPSHRGWYNNRTSSDGRQDREPTEKYKELVETYNPGVADDLYADCSHFVGTMVLASGLDSSFPDGNSVEQYNYLEGGGNGKWTTVATDYNFSEKQGEGFRNLGM